MGLTKPRAYQIFDIDYKQAVRVITLTNVTLSGGAPSTVDGVSLGLGSRILVAGQSTGSQNGVYQVSVLGTGSNGTWIRSVDTNESGELNAGTIIMVTEGTTYKDTQWKLTTNDPIVIGTTALVFEQNSAFAFGNIYANSTAVLANTVGDTVTLTPGNNIVITGNAATDTITFAVKDAPTFFGNVNPGANITYDLGNTTNRWRDIYLANSTIYLGNAQISANATAVIITNPAGGTTVLSGATPAVDANTVTATGNITGGNLITSGVLSVTGNANVGNLGATNANLTAVTVTGNANVGNLDTAGQIIATGNITGGNVNLSGNIVDTGALFLITGASGNVTLAPNGTNVLVATTTGANITGTLNATGNANVGNIGATNANLTAITVSGNANVGNLGTTAIVATGAISGSTTLSVTGNANVGNLDTAGLITATGNITGGNISTGGALSVTGIASVVGGLKTNSITSATASVTLYDANQTAINIGGSSTLANVKGTFNAVGNANVGNLGTAGLITVTGNVNAGGFSTAGNITGAYFLGNVACASGIFTTKIFNGTSEANIGTSGGNANISISGTANVVVVSTAGANIAGTLGVTGNITGGNVSGTLLTGTLATAAQPNVTSVGTLTSLSVTGNVTGGNLVTTGTVSTGTLSTSGNATIAGNLTVSGNVISVNVTNLNVVDPIIGLGRGANNTPLTSNDGKDRGQELWYYTTSEQAAFMGYDNSAGKLIAATNVSVSNEVVTVNDYGNLIVGGLESTTISASGNANVGNLGATTVAATTLTGTLSTAAQPNITSVGSLSSLTVTGNTTSGNFIGTLNGSGANVTTISATNVSSGTLAQARLANSAVTLGNTTLTLGDTVTTVAGLSSVTSTSFVGALTGAATTAATVTTAAQPNITSVGTLSSLTVTGNVSGGNLTTAGLISATGNVSGGNLTTSGQVSATGNVSGGNLTTAGQVSATGNVSGGNLTTAGLISATGNVTGAVLKATGNVEIQNRGILFLNDSDNSNYIGLRSPATLTGNFTYIFPTGYGNASQVLTTNGAGGLTWEDQSGGGGGGGATSFPNSTVSPVPGSTGNFDLSFNFVQTSQETPFESGATDPFGVNLGEVYSMMDPGGEILDPVDLGVLT